MNERIAREHADIIAKYGGIHMRPAPVKYAWDAHPFQCVRFVQSSTIINGYMFAGGVRELNGPWFKSATVWINVRGGKSPQTFLPEEQVHTQLKKLGPESLFVKLNGAREAHNTLRLEPRTSLSASLHVQLLFETCTAPFQHVWIYKGLLEHMDLTDLFSPVFMDSKNRDPRDVNYHIKGGTPPPPKRRKSNPTATKCGLSSSDKKLLRELFYNAKDALRKGAVCVLCEITEIKGNRYGRSLQYCHMAPRGSLSDKQNTDLRYYVPACANCNILHGVQKNEQLNVWDLLANHKNPNKVYEIASIFYDLKTMRFNEELNMDLVEWMGYFYGRKSVPKHPISDPRVYHLLLVGMENSARIKNEEMEKERNESIAALDAQYNNMFKEYCARRNTILEEYDAHQKKEMATLDSARNHARTCVRDECTHLRVNKDDE